MIYKIKNLFTKKNPSNQNVPANILELEETMKEFAMPDEVKKFKNIHKGERCFIIGNGPSLNQIDLEKLKNEKTFAVNGIFYKTEENGFTPTYYMVEDSSVMKENLDKIKQYKAKAKFYPSTYAKLLSPTDENTYFFIMNRGFYEKRSPNFCIPRFSTDFAEKGYCGQSVTILNLQLAFYMGFEEVYLIGMDFNYNIPKEFEKKGDIITSTGDDPNHFHPDYFGKGKTWKDPKLDRVLNNYKKAKEVYSKHGRTIYNATPGGNLKIFKRKDFDSIFKKD